MLGEVPYFLTLCSWMYMASYIIGYLPLMGNLGESKIRLISTFGAGLLIGTAFAVVVPEGIDALHSAAEKEGHRHHLDKPQIIVLPEAKPDAVTTPTTVAPQQHEHEETGRMIGIMILIGFLFMFIVDQLSKQSFGGSRRKLSTTIGLCVHALADGVLLGSASSTHNADVQFVVFLALIVHKGPSAFALTSLLLLEKLERFRIKRHLTIFSASAPVGALLTYFLLKAVEGGFDSSSRYPGMFMLFSAGTFVYVAAAHVLPELQDIESSCNPQASPDPLVAGSHHGNGLTFREMFVLMIGALSPAMLIHGHHH